MPASQQLLPLLELIGFFFKLVFKNLSLDFSSFLPLSIRNATIHMTLYLAIVFLDFINPPLT